MYLLPQHGTESGALQMARSRRQYPTLTRNGFLPMPITCRPRVRRRRALYPSPAFLGTYLGIDPSVDSMFGTVSSKAGFTSQDKANYEAWVDSGYLPAYYKKNPGDCGTATTTASPVMTALTAGFSITGSSLLKAGLTTANPIIAAAGAATEVLGDIFGIFGGHHAAAVAKEQDTLCQIIPAVNSALQVIDQALAAGQMTTAQAQQALANTMSGYQQAVSQIIKMNSSQCNAACVYERALKGIIAQRLINLQNAPPPADQEAAAVSDMTSSLSSLPSWAPYALGAAVLWFLL